MRPSRDLPENKGVEPTAAPDPQEGVVAIQAATAAISRRPDLNPAVNPATAEAFAETLPQEVRDSLGVALLQNPSLLEKIPDDIRAKLSDGDALGYSMGRLNDLSEVDILRMSRAVSLPPVVEEYLRKAESQNPNLNYEASVNVWGKAPGNEDWHLVAMQVDPSLGERMKEAILKLGMVEGHIQKPYECPPYRKVPEGGLG